MEKLIFGMSCDEIARQCEADTLLCDSNSPIQAVGASNPCIEGGKKILADEQSRDFFRRVYVGSNGNE